MFALLLGLLAFAPMVLEARLSARNESRLRAAGATEPSGDVYRLMQVVYPASFLAMIAEAWIGRAAPAGPFAAGLALFAAAKGLKYWAIRTLGPRWTFRVLVPPAATSIISGPYRFLRHPNYVGVVGELAGMAAMARAPVAGTVALAVFSLLILARVRVENRALSAVAAEPADGGDC